MKTAMGGQIRRLRRERGLTQEQLAEAMGVTVGAVSKWESGMSYPEVALLTELADFFEVSTDILLGYDWRAHGANTAVERIRGLTSEKKYPELRGETRKALQKYPNHFQVLYYSAVGLAVMAAEQSDEALWGQVGELLDRACGLIGQNTDPEITLESIRREQAIYQAARGDYARAAEILKAANVCGVQNARIGQYLTYGKKRQEATKYLSRAYLDMLANLYITASNLAENMSKTGEPEEAQALLRWAEGTLAGAEQPGVPSYLLKMRMFLRAQLAVLLRAGEHTEEALRELEEAQRLAERYDGDPNDSCLRFRFYRGEQHSCFDDAGTAAEAMEMFLTEDEILAKLWKERKKTNAS